MRNYYHKNKDKNVGFATKQQAKTWLNQLLLNNPEGLPFPTIMNKIHDKESRVNLSQHRITNYLARDPELYKDGKVWKHVNSKSKDLHDAKLLENMVHEGDSESELRNHALKKIDGLEDSKTYIQLH